MISKASEIYKYKNNKKDKVLDQVVVEYKLKIFLNDKILVERICLKNEMDKMVAGYLITEGYINSWNGILEMKFKDYNENEGECRCKVKRDQSDSDTTCSEIRLSGSTVLNLMKEFTNKSKLFKKTGGVHSCGLAKNDKIVYFTDDVGRQNALDKMIGHLAKKESDLNEVVVLFSGRITSEVVEKLKLNNIKGIITKAAVTWNGRVKGIEKNLIIIGFARGERFNIYNGEDKII
jgi:FdhD protein